MNDSERLIARYLAHKGYSDVVHEPDGKQPPDFLVNGGIAVEVRRLNQNQQTGAHTQGLEETAIPLDRSVRKVLSSMGPSTDGVSWFVSYSFRRPLPSGKEFERTLRTALTNAMANGIKEGESWAVTRRFKIRFHRASKSHPTRFLLGGWGDHDAGGFVVAELARNLRICVAQKTEKIARVRSKYPEWWLALDDRIAYASLEADDRALLRTLFAAEPPWDRIILVSPIDATHGFEL